MTDEVRDPAGYTPMQRIKNARNMLLNASDWTQGSDSPLSDSEKTKWANYRQELRDLPANSTPSFQDDGVSLTGVTWPTKPTE